MTETARAIRAQLLTIVAQFARVQRGVISREQLRALGCSDGWIDDRVREGVLRRILPGVFAVGPGELTREAMWRAAALSGGPDATLSHLSAATFWGLLRDDGSRPDIIVGKDRGVAGDQIAAHRCKLFEEDVLVTGGMRVTLPMRTLVDVADSVSRPVLAEAFNQALLRESYEPQVIARLLAQARGRHGLKNLRTVIANLGGTPHDVRSRGEWLARDILIAASVGEPEMNAELVLGDGRRRYADLFFADVRLDVEIDGPHHRLLHVRREDAIRTAELAAVGVVVVRYPDTLLSAAPATFAADVRAQLALLRGAAGLAA
jgi:hypothetical protein